MDSEAKNIWAILPVQPLVLGGPGLKLSLNPNQETNANNYTITSNTTTWMDAPYLEGAFIINLGELMLRWTND